MSNNSDYDWANLFLATRTAAGLTQKEVGQMLYTDPSNIAKIENGHRSPTLTQFIDFFDYAKEHDLAEPFHEILKGE